MAGYFLNSLDWDGFRRFVEEPTPAQIQAFAGLIARGLKGFGRKSEKGDPIRDWPGDPEALSGLLKGRLLRTDWYGDLSDPGKEVWAEAIGKFCMGRKPKGAGSRVEGGDSVYWDVIEIAGRHHGIPNDRATGSILSQFGTRPYRYHPDPDRPVQWGDWMPDHSMHTPEEVQQLLAELKEAGPAILSSPEEGPRIDYEKELLPVVEKVAREGRMLYVAVDT